MVSTSSAHKQKTTLADGSSGVAGHGGNTERGIETAPTDNGR